MRVVYQVVGGTSSLSKTRLVYGQDPFFLHNIAQSLAIFFQKKSFQSLLRKIKKAYCSILFIYICYLGPLLILTLFESWLPLHISKFSWSHLYSDRCWRPLRIHRCSRWVRWRWSEYNVKVSLGFLQYLVHCLGRESYWL